MQKEYFNNPYFAEHVVVPSAVIMDDAISWKAKGVYTYLISKPSDWIFYMSEIVNHAIDGKDSLRSAVKELEDAGYLTRELSKDGGKFGAYVWSIHTSPCRVFRSGKSATTINKRLNTNSRAETSEPDYKFWVSFWNEKHGTGFIVTEPKKKQIRARLRTFTKEQLLEAIDNRLNNEWLKDNPKYLRNWDAFWRNDEKVDKYLNQAGGNKNSDLDTNSVGIKAGW